MPVSSRTRKKHKKELCPYEELVEFVRIIPGTARGDDQIDESQQTALVQFGDVACVTCASL